jgi:hypothetical protein
MTWRLRVTGETISPLTLPRLFEPLRRDLVGRSDGVLYRVHRGILTYPSGPPIPATRLTHRVRRARNCVP